MTPRRMVFSFCMSMVFCRARHRNRRTSLIAFRRPPTPDTSRVSLARTLPAVWKKCAGASSGALEAPSGPPPRATCAARRARRLPSASRAHPNPDEHGRRVGRRRALRRSRAPRRAQELRRRRGSPGIGRRARHPPPRSRCVPPGSPTSGRGDAAWTSSATLPSIVPRARGRALRAPRTRPRAAADPNSADKANVVGIRSLSVAFAPRRVRSKRVVASGRARPLALERAPLTLSNPLEPSRHLSRRQSRRARPGALSGACSA